MFPHGPIERLEPGLFVVNGQIKIKPLGRKMTIVGSKESGLFVHNAVMLDDATFAELDELGKVTGIFVPNRYHDMDGGRFKQRYPDARLFSMPEAAEALKKKFPAIEPLDPAALPPNVTVRAIPGLKGGENVMEVKTDAGTTQVYTDAFFNLDHAPGLHGLIVRAIGSSGGFKMTFIGRTFLLDDKKAFLSWLDEQIARKDLVRVIVSHGRIVEGGASEALAHARKLLT
jgi:hypothetical protein